MKFGITVFTPTYNRAHTLERVYNSLKKQTDKRFEWLIIDDGSTDNTKELVLKWKKEKIININYIYQKNQGKTQAHNKGVKNAQYNIFICLDSDDFLDKYAIEELNKVNEIIQNNNKVVGIIAKKKNIASSKESNNKHIPKTYITVGKLYRRYHYKDELALAYKTYLLKDNLFPKIEGEKFIPEAYLYDKLDAIGLLYFVQKELYFYEYQEDGYTSNSSNLLKKNIKGYMLYAKNRMEHAPIIENRIKGAIQYNIANMIYKKSKKYLICRHFLILLLTYPISYIYYKKKYKQEE